MTIANVDTNNFQNDFSFESLRKRMSERLQKVRRINNVDESEVHRVNIKEEQNIRQ